MNKDELELLLEKARNLDEDALAALFEAYYSKVLKFRCVDRIPEE